MVRHKGPAPTGFLLSLPRRDRFIILGALVAAVLLLFGLAFWGSPQATPAAEASDPTPSTVVEPAPVVVAQPPASASSPPSEEQSGPPTVAGTPVGEEDRDVAPAPGMDPDVAPPDGPGPDVPPFGVDALAMRDELRTHGVDLPDGDLYKLVDAANKYIAEDDPDLDAWDPRITADVKALWPDLSRELRIDVVRCTAEYIERVIARNHGWSSPPDSDDHNHTVSGRGPQPRVTPPTDR